MSNIPTVDAFSVRPVMQFTLRGSALISDFLAWATASRIRSLSPARQEHSENRPAEDFYTASFDVGDAAVIGVWLRARASEVAVIDGLNTMHVVSRPSAVA